MSQVKKTFFLWMGFNCLKARATLRRQFTFYHKSPEIPGTHFIELGRMSRPWSHPVVVCVTLNNLRGYFLTQYIYILYNSEVLFKCLFPEIFIFPFSVSVNLIYVLCFCLIQTEFKIIFFCIFAWSYECEQVLKGYCFIKLDKQTNKIQHT